MQVWNVLRAARGKYSTQKIAKKSPSGHHPTALSGYIFATKACIDNRKNLLSSCISSTCPHNTVNFVPLAAEICWRVWGTPANFNGFRVLAALLDGIPVLGVSQTLRRWTEGATYIRQGGHHIGYWPTFLVNDTPNRCRRYRLRYFLLKLSAIHIIDTDTSTLYGRRMEEGRPLYFCPVVSSFSSFYFFIPRLISAVADWMSAILPQMAWP